MVEFEVKDMTCDHCASRIRKALTAADAQATVEIDVRARRLRVSGALDAQTAAEAIAAAGYRPVAA